MRTISFETKAFEQFTDWATTDKRIFKKILSLIRDAQKAPFSGIGKPEPLKYELQGCWSRRITEEHRLVYKVEQDSLIILSCRYHYD
ncbi:MAG: Txe/YoeB family addiction module toxin [Crocosphaera sp.]|nr:Txe/YoeB family addiction module toxin [Crocosphaera sp.]